MLLHGLESNSNSTLSLDLANSYVRKRFDISCINYRGLSAIPNPKLGGYHLGFMSDLVHYLGLLHDQRSEVEEEEEEE